jgi:hypothetical protein
MKSLAKMTVAEEVQEGQEEGEGIQEIVEVEEPVIQA